MSDSLKLEATGRDRDRLVAALRLAPRQRISGVVYKDNSLVLSYQYSSSGPAYLTFLPELMADTVLDWISQTSQYPTPPRWPTQPNIDGDVEKGWRLVADQDKIEIHPHWMIYHK